MSACFVIGICTHVGTEWEVTKSSKAGIFGSRLEEGKDYYIADLLFKMPLTDSSWEA